MGYALGVDLGTTFTAAAVGRGSEGQPLQLGTDAAQVPSVVLVRNDGEVVVGDAAERRATSEPNRAAREFKRRLGDSVPFVIGGAPYSIEALMGHQLRDVVRRATEQEGEAPSLVVLTHPANYSEFKRNALREAARLAGIDADRVQLLTEPEAAAVAYSRQQRIEPGEVVAIYDLGGGTFDAALVRNTGQGFELIGVPEGMERLGGIDFDQAVLAHVDRSVDGLVSGADRSDPAVLPAQNRLRSECRRAKEALSSDADAMIPVDVPGVHTSVRLTRSEFEQMIGPRIAETVAALERAVSSAGISTEQLGRVLLVGGSSRMPLVAEMVRTATGRPVALDAHPKLAIATGAALVGAAAVGRLAPPAPAGAAPAAVDTAWQPPTRAPADAETAAARSKNRTRLAVAVGAVVGVAAVAAIVALNRSDDTADSVSGLPTTVSVVSSTVPPAIDTAVGASTASTPSTASTTLPGSTTPPPVATVPVASSSPFVVNLFAFGGAPGQGVPGPAAAAGQRDLGALAVDGATTYIVDGALDILRVSGDTVERFATLESGAGSIGGITVFGGTAYVTEARGVSVVQDGAATLLVDRATVGLGATPGPITHDGVGNLYFADNDNHRIIRRGTDGTLTLVAGNGAVPVAGEHGGDGSAATTVAIGQVTALAIDLTGRLLLGDASALTVRAVSVDGTISTLAGGGLTALDATASPGSPGLAATELAWGSVSGLTVDSGGRVYVADDRAGAIVRLDADGTAVVVIRRVGGVAVQQGVATDQSSVGALGQAAMGAAGLLFVDDRSVRSITQD